jgi:nitroreductase
MDYESLLGLVKQRRSIRKFRPDPVPAEYIEKIIEVVRWAPSGANSQPWGFVVVQDPALKKQVAAFILEEYDRTCKMELLREPQMRYDTKPGRFVQAPMFIVICGDVRTKDVYPMNATVNIGDSVFFSSLANAVLYMNLAITCLGLGAQWVSNISMPYARWNVKKLLKIPDEVRIYDMLAVG